MIKRLTVVALALTLVATACSGDSGSADKTSTTASGSNGTATDTTPPQPLDDLSIIYPETLAFQAPFTFIDGKGALAPLTDAVSLGNWNSPDVLRSLLIKGDADVAAVPTYVGANLYNKEIDVRMVAVVVWGLVWLLGPEGQEGDWDAIRGQTVMIPFQNDMPDIVFKYLARANGLEPGKDFKIEYYAFPPAIIAPLVQGTGKWAVLPEHIATLALEQANANGQHVTRALDLQKEWAEATGSGELIPQAGVVMPGKLVDERPDVVEAFFKDLEASVARVNEAGPETIATLAEASGLKPDVVEGLIPRLNLKVVSGADSRKSLEDFFTELAEESPDLIGGKLPDAGFYVKIG